MRDELQAKLDQATDDLQSKQGSLGKALQAQARVQRDLDASRVQVDSQRTRIANLERLVGASRQHELDAQRLDGEKIALAKDLETERQARIAAENANDAALQGRTAAEADRDRLLAKRRAAQVQLNSLSSILSSQAPAQPQRPSTAPDPHHATPILQYYPQRRKSLSPSRARVRPAHGKRRCRSSTGPPPKRQRGPPVVEPDDDEQDDEEVDTLFAVLAASRAAARRKSSTGSTLEDPITLDNDGLDGVQDLPDQGGDRSDEHGSGDRNPPDQSGGRGGPGTGGFSPDGSSDGGGSGGSTGSSDCSSSVSSHASYNSLLSRQEHRDLTPTVVPRDQWIPGYRRPAQYTNAADCAPWPLQDVRLLSVRRLRVRTLFQQWTRPKYWLFPHSRRAPSATTWFPELITETNIRALYAASPPPWDALRTLVVPRSFELTGWFADFCRLYSDFENAHLQVFGRLPTSYLSAMP
ncbi:hypothetical protein V7S43_015703 [Phytophthora oleae]|uniref:Uncharacterized protein n=1 Tax=Phytophthora oleae TaxID=2107226 RepID=A0ABD3EY00_9STRA